MKPHSLRSTLSKPSGALAVLWLGIAGAQANVLSNGKLDTISIGPQNLNTPTGWAVDAFRLLAGPHPDACSSEPWCNVLDPGGYGLFFKPFQGSAADPITVHFYQDNAATPGTKYTLSAWAAGETRFSGFFNTNTPPPATVMVVAFLDGSSSVLASNAYDLIAAGLPSGGPGSMIQFTMPQVTAPAGTVTVRAGVSMINAYSTSGGQSFFVDALEMISEAPAGAPVITNQPAHVTVSPGGTATFSVAVSNPSGVTYQWQRYGTNLANGGNISGATSATLTVSNAGNDDVGHYRVIASNNIGAVNSAIATLQVVGVNFYPVIAISGKIGDVNLVEYSTAVAPTTWIPLSTNTLSTSPEYVIDKTAPGNNTRFYRVTYQQP